MLSTATRFIVFVYLLCVVDSRDIGDGARQRQIELMNVHIVRPVSLTTELEQDAYQDQRRVRSPAQRRDIQISNREVKDYQDAPAPYEHIKDQGSFDAWVDEGRPKPDRGRQDLQSSQPYEQEIASNDRSFPAEENYGNDADMQRKIELGKTMEETDASMVQRFESSEEVVHLWICSARFPHFPARILKTFTAIPFLHSPQNECNRILGARLTPPPPPAGHAVQAAADAQYAAAAAVAADEARYAAGRPTPADGIMDAPPPRGGGGVGDGGESTQVHLCILLRYHCDCWPIRSRHFSIAALFRCGDAPL
jgi:hypothetical protein